MTIKSKIVVLLLTVSCLVPSAHAAFSDKGPCLLGDRQACLRYAKTKGLTREESEPAYNLACDGNIAEACVALGYISAKDHDYSASVEKFNHAIELGSRDGAAGLGLVYAKMGKSDQALIYMNKACAAGDRESCQDAKNLTRAPASSK